MADTSREQRRPVGTMLRLLRNGPRSDVRIAVALMIIGAMVDAAGILLTVPTLRLLLAPSRNGRPLQITSSHVADPNSLIKLLVALSVLIAVRAALRWQTEMANMRLQHSIIDALRERCFRVLIGAEWHWLARRRLADHSALLIGNIARIGTGFQQGLSVISIALLMFTYFATALILSWPITLLALILGSALVFGAGGYKRHAAAFGFQLSRANIAMHRRIEDSLRAIRAAKMNGTQGAQTNAFNDVVSELREEQIRFVERTGRDQVVFQIAGVALFAILLYLSVGHWRMSLAIVLPVGLILFRLVPMMSAMRQAWSYWLHALPALAEIEHLIADAAAAAEPSDGNAHVTLTEALEITKVRFTYAGRDKPTLDNVTLRFPARSTSAISGPSGVGKSTLADLISGLLTPDQGSICADGVDIQTCRQSWRRSVAYVQQDAVLLHDTIRANLLWAVPDCQEAAIRGALRQAAADFVFSLPLGLDTIVGDAGVQLSGGERQRIALARALIGKPQLLILDEATSALDATSEDAIVEALRRLHGTLTVIVIGHRSAMIGTADQIFYLP